MTTTWNEIQKFPNTGSNLVTDGTFTGFGWTLGNGWAYGLNNATHTPGPGTDSSLEQVLPGVVANSVYSVTFTVVVSAGIVELECDFAGFNRHFEIPSSGTYTFITYSGPSVSGPGDQTIIFDASDTFSGSISNVSAHVVAGATWTDILKPSGNAYTDIPKPSNGSTVIYGGTPIGLLLALTYAQTMIIGGNWINVAENGASWTNVLDHTATWTKIPKAV